MGIARRIVWWDFERASWQWDVLCLLIVAFIFLTPKQWFDFKERPTTRPSKIIVQADGSTADRSRLESKVRELTGDKATEIIGVTEKKDPSGATYYEVVIR